MVHHKILAMRIAFCNLSDHAWSCNFDIFKTSQNWVITTNHNKSEELIISSLSFYHSDYHTSGSITIVQIYLLSDLFLIILSISSFLYVGHWWLVNSLITHKCCKTCKIPAREIIIPRCKVVALNKLELIRSNILALFLI